MAEYFNVMVNISLSVEQPLCVHIVCRLSKAVAFLFRILVNHKLLFLSDTLDLAVVLFERLGIECTLVNKRIINKYI